MSFSEARFWEKVTITPDHWIWNRCQIKHGYGRVRVNGKLVLAHRVSLSLELGLGPNGLPPSEDVDHRCFMEACVNPAHLRRATTKQNMEHRKGARRDARSGVRGVSWAKDRGQWRAGVRHNGKQHYAGSFDDLAEAEQAAVALRMRLFTHNDIDRAAA